jgi:hypothetical protein
MVVSREARGIQVCKLNIPYSKHLEPEVFLIWGFFSSRFLECLHMHNEIPQGWDPSLNMKLIN